MSERPAIRARDRYHKYRKEVISELGGCCCRCGFPDVRALQIDHVNGAGSAERRKFGTSNNCRRMLLAVRNGSKEYQLLCANCNAIKMYEAREHVPRIYTATLEPVKERRPCGTHAAYHRGCRCQACIVAHRDYCRPRMRKYCKDRATASSEPS